MIPNVSSENTRNVMYHDNKYRYELTGDWRCLIPLDVCSVQDTAERLFKDSSFGADKRVDVKRKAMQISARNSGYLVTIRFVADICSADMVDEDDLRELAVQVVELDRI
jgi:hypothetical protein